MVTNMLHKLILEKLKNKIIITHLVMFLNILCISIAISLFYYCHVIIFFSKNSFLQKSCMLIL